MENTRGNEYKLGNLGKVLPLCKKDIFYNETNGMISLLVKEFLSTDTFKMWLDRVLVQS